MPPRRLDQRRSTLPRLSLARGHGSELAERLSDELRQVSLSGLDDPAFTCDLEDSDRQIGSEDCGCVSDTAPVQCLGHRRRMGCTRDQLALLELCVRRNDGVALLRECPSLLEDGSSSFETCSCRVDRRQVRRCIGDRAAACYGTNRKTSCWWSIKDRGILFHQQMFLH